MAIIPAHWVDEQSECRPVSKRSVQRLAAEKEWLSLGENTAKPVAILRLSGIYGPGRNAFVNLANGTAKRLIKPGQVFNRIHCDDIAGALWHLAGRNIGGVFNVTDDEPAPPQDVVTYAAKLMGIEPPPEIPFEIAQLSPMAGLSMARTSGSPTGRSRRQVMISSFRTIARPSIICGRPAPGMAPAKATPEARCARISPRDWRVVL